MSQSQKAKRKILAYACDDNFFEYTKASFASFCEHHSLSEWRVIFADVGLQPWQRAELARFGEVIEYEPYRLKQHDGVIFSAARARIKMLTDFIHEDDVLLYLDSDTLIFENLNNLVSEFVESVEPIAIGLEDIDEFWRSPVSSAWLDGKIPAEFQNQKNWHNAPMANAGVLLAQGAGAIELGKNGLDLFEKYSAQLWLPEQAVIDTLLYDRGIPFMKLPPRFNCLAWEKHITHIGVGPKYVDTRPYFRGESVAIRHFAGHDENLKTSKLILNEALPLLNVNVRLSRIANKSEKGICQNLLIETKASKPSIAVAINIFKEPLRQIEECFLRIANNLPNAIVAIFLDGVDRPEVSSLARKYGFLPVISSHYGTNSTWNLWWLRMLYFFDFSKADVCFKLDPDTMVDITPNAIPKDHYFGDVHAGGSFVQGGVTGISRVAVSIILDKKLLEPVVGEPRHWLTRTEADFSDDRALGCLLRHIDILPVQWSECKSVWKSPIENNPITYAIVHPRYYDDPI